MTAMPQLVSLFNAVGGGAAALIAIDDYLGLRGRAVRLEINIAIVLDIIIGSITFTGSLIASGKLQGLRSRRQADHHPGRPARDARPRRDRRRRRGLPVRRQPERRGHARDPRSRR